MNTRIQQAIQQALDEHFGDKGIDQFIEAFERDGDGFLVTTTNGCIVGEKKGQRRVVFDQETHIPQFESRMAS